MLFLWGVWETETFCSLKSSPFRFWQWGSSNVFHHSLCFLCSASGIENKPKWQGKAHAPSSPCQCLGGTKAGTRVCVCVRMLSTDGFVKGCAGMQDVYPKEKNVFEFCFLRTRFLLYLACSYQFHKKCGAGCCPLPALSKETKDQRHKVTSLFSDS